jgi:hypothetical protein
MLCESRWDRLVMISGSRGEIAVYGVGFGCSLTNNECTVRPNTSLEKGLTNTSDEGKVDQTNEEDSDRRDRVCDGLRV